MGGKRTRPAAATFPNPGGDEKLVVRAGEQDHDGHPGKRQRIQERTDSSRWRMRDDEGRMTWHYLETDEELKTWPQSYADKYYLGLPLVGISYSPSPLQ